MWPVSTILGSAVLEKPGLELLQTGWNLPPGAELAQNQPPWVRAEAWNPTGSFTSPECQSKKQGANQCWRFLFISFYLNSKRKLDAWDSWVRCLLESYQGPLAKDGSTALPPSDKRQMKWGCVSFLFFFRLFSASFRAVGKHTITMGEILKAGAQVTKGGSFLLSDYS